MIHTDGIQTIANAPTKRTYHDPLSYAIIVEDVPVEGAQLRARRMVSEVVNMDVLAELARWHRMRGNRVTWREGKLGQERTRYFAVAGELFKLDGSGVPVLIGGTA